MNRNTLDKIIPGYMGAITREDFVYKDQIIKAKPLHISPLIFRGYTCPAKCGGCCPVFSLVYLPFEEMPYPMTEKKIFLNGEFRSYYADDQKENADHFCKHLNQENGRCNIHGRHPFSCDFEILRILKHTDHNVLITKLYGRGWNFERIDHERGALCEIIPMQQEEHADIIRRLERLKQWADYFGFITHMDAILDYVRSGPHEKPVILEPDKILA